MKYRPRLHDFAGRLVSLPDDPESWIGQKPFEHSQEIQQPTQEAILLLGLGPGRPEKLPFTCGKHVFWLEEPRILRLLSAKRPSGHLPKNWQKVSVRKALELAPFCSVYEYRLNSRLAPLFWGPIMGRLNLRDKSNLKIYPVKSKNDCNTYRGVVLLPGTERQLLHFELIHALGKVGFEVLRLPLWSQDRQNSLAVWEQTIAKHRPVLALSVNFRGLDPEGKIFWLCRAAGITVAVWCVDNPWHLLSGISLPWWKKVPLFVTDASFIAPLKKAGAQAAHYLPLAVSPHMWLQKNKIDRNTLSPFPLFVGHSAFAEQAGFFAAARVPVDTLTAMQQQKYIPGASDHPNNAHHFHQWVEKLNISLWPGQSVRCAGLGADLCSRARRTHWIAGALPTGLRIIGDDGWRSLLPEVNILPQVDYYTTLPTCYARTVVLNVTSLLLPHSLNQRHFDVWAAGGFLLSDATPGLEIFPKELTRPIILESPEDFSPRLASLLADAQTRQLCAQWQNVLRDAHGYEHRVTRICEHLNL